MVQVDDFIVATASLDVITPAERKQRAATEQCAATEAAPTEGNDR